MDHRVLGVVGASGGLGASTLAVALAVRAAASVGATVCVDTAFERGGLDVTACLEHVAGLRWPDLEELRGAVDGADLLRALPSDGPLRVLGARGSVPPDDVVDTCVSALSSISALTVVDLGASVRWVGSCTDVLLVSGVSARHLADASAMAATLVGRQVPTRLVLRAGRREAVTAEEVALHLDLPHAATVRDDAQVASDADRARIPGSRSGGGFVEAVDRVWLQLDDPGAERGAGPGVPPDRRRTGTGPAVGTVPAARAARSAARVEAGRVIA